MLKISHYKYLTIAALFKYRGAAVNYKAMNYEPFSPELFTIIVKVHDFLKAYKRTDAVDG